jgi:two-component system chemotaxis response regulator CheB
MELNGGGFYIAPPDRHMRIADSRIQLDPGPLENGHRPAIDPLFRSAADAFGSRAAGVVLSGTLDDGTVGLYCIKESGGAALAQEPTDALFPAMPANAIAYANPDYVLPIEELVDTLVRLTAGSNGRPGKEISVTNDPAPHPSSEDAQPGVLAPFSCPDCGGTLWETEEGRTVSYRCRVGHAYTMNSLVARHVDSLERTLWSAYRALEERAAMSRRVARRLEDRGRTESARRFERQAQNSAHQATELKALLDSLEAAPDVGLDAVAESRG